MTDKQQPVAWAVYKGDECLRVHEKREWAEDWARAEAHFGSVGPYHIRELFAAPPAQPDHQGHSCTHKCTWPQCEAAQPAPAQEPQPVSNTDELPQRLSDERAAFEAWHNEYRTQELVRRDDTYYNTHVRCRWEGWQARAIESALQPGWRDIESAPKDELILVGPTKRMGICVAMHHSRDGWVTETCSEWMTIYTPTHWMPLPPAPKATK